MLLTLLAYLTYREVRDANSEPETSEEAITLFLKAISVVLFWPYFLVLLEKYQETDGQKRRLIISVCVFSLLSAIFGFYLVVGVVVGIIRGTAYLHAAYKYQQSKVEEAQVEE